MYIQAADWECDLFTQVLYDSGENWRINTQLYQSHSVHSLMSNQLITPKLGYI